MSSLLTNPTLITGLNDEMVKQVEGDADLECVMKLHLAVENVKRKNKSNSEQIYQLKQLFDKLGDNIKQVMKDAQEKPTPPAGEGAGKEKKGGAQAAGGDKGKK